MATPRRHRHWADHPVGIRLDRVWRTVEQPTESFDDAAGEPEYVQPSPPPSDGMRVRRHYHYEYGASKPSLHPDLVLARVAITEHEPIRIERPKPKPLKREQNPDTFVPPPAPAVPVDMHEPCGESSCDDPLYCVGHPPARSKKQKKKQERKTSEVDSERLARLRRENDELKEKLRRLERDTLQPTELPVFVQPFVCSSCDPSSPMFDRAHSRCTSGECACYNQTPAQHDATRRES